MSAVDEQQAAAYREQAARRKAFTRSRIAVIRGSSVVPDQIRADWLPLHQALVMPNLPDVYTDALRERLDDQYGIFN